MRSSILAVASMATIAAADFHIYHQNVISSDPYLPGGYEAVFNNLESMNCDDAGNMLGIGWVGDASGGGARCEGCPFDAESIDAWDITEFEWKDDEVTTWNDGWITLRKEEGDPSRYFMSYVNEGRDESGVITNSYCVRDGSTEMSCTGPNLSNSIVKKIFTCYTSLTATIN